MTISCSICGMSGPIKFPLPRGAKVRCKGCGRIFEPVTSREWSGLALAGGRYRVTAKLGEGGMGFVYRALDQNIDSDVVIKVPRQAMMDDPDFAGRFTREIRSLVKLSHPHIVKVTDVGNYDGIPFAVMQYLAGGSLEDQRPVASSGQVLPCDPRSVSRWLLAVAEALDYIHSQGYVHRDVKPGNILFDTQGHAFLSDFGVAKVLASAENPAPSQTAMTGAGMVLGTPEYMAPELIMGNQFDGRVDQYALAITVYELLCGRRPFEDETKTRVLVLHTSQAPSPLTAWCPTLPARLSQAVLKGLAKEPSQRYPSCVALARAVAEVAENAGSQNDRVRLKCSSCGKTGSIPAADLAWLKAGGGHAACPACKSPIDIGNAVQVAFVPSTAGTMAFSIPAGTTGEYGLAREQSPASSGGSSGGHARPAAAAGHSGTMAMFTSDSDTPPAVPGQVSPPARPVSGTIIERTLPRGDHTEGFRDIFDALDSAGTQGAGAQERPKPGADQTRTWIAIGAAVAAGLLATAATAFFFLSGSKQVAGSPSSTRTADAGPLPPTKDHLSQVSPKEAKAPLVGWKMSLDSRTDKGSSIPSATLASSMETSHPASPKGNAAEMLRTPEEAPSVPSPPRKGTKTTETEQPLTREPVSPPPPNEPKPKPDAVPSPEDSAPEAILAQRGLKKEGSWFVVATEYEVMKGYDRALPYWKRTEAAWGELSQAWELEVTARNLEDQQTNLQFTIGDLKAQIASLPTGRMAPAPHIRQALQDQLRLAHDSLSEVTRQLNLVNRKRPGLPRLEALRNVFIERRAEFFEESNKLLHTVKRLEQEYEELGKDTAVVNAIRALKEDKKAPIFLGPSGPCKKAVSKVKESQKLLSYNPDSFRSKKRTKLKESPKAKDRKNG
jgi:serine/threonine protein kinase